MANEVQIRVNTQGTKEAIKGSEDIKQSFAGLRKSILPIATGFAGLAGAGVLLGRSFISAAMQAGAASNEFFEFQDASFELRRALGELLIKVLSPILGILAKFATGLTKVVDAVQPIIWRNWETILEGIRSSLGLLDKTLGGLFSSLGLFNRETKESGESVGLLDAFIASLGEDFEKLKEDLKTIEENTPGILKLLELTPLGPPLKLVGEAIKLIKENLPEQGSQEALIEIIKAIIPGLREWELLAKAIGLIADALERINNFNTTDFSGLFDPGGEVEAGTGMVSEGGPFGVITRFIKAVVEKSKELLQGFVDWLINKSFPDLRKAFKAAGKGIQTAWTNVFNAMFGEAETESGTGKGSTGNIRSIIANFVQAVKNLWEQLKLDGKKAFEDFKSMAVEKWESIKEAILGKVDEMRKKINAFIRFWNDLEFRVPRIQLPFGGSVGGFTVPTPDLDEIPPLARGGTVQRSGMALVGERGPELLSLPKGAQVSPLASTGAGVQVSFNGPVFTLIDLENHILEVVRDAFLTGAFRGAM